MLNGKSFDKSNGSEDMEKFKKLNRESKRHGNKAAKMRDAEKRQENQRSNYDYMGKHPYN